MCCYHNMSALVWCGLIAVLRFQLVTSLYTLAPKIDCNDGGFYIRADPTNCSNFYKCDHGNPVLFNCPSGLYFNPAIHVCDWPRNVKCMISNSGSSQQDNGNNGNHYNQASQQSGSYNNDGPQYNNQKPYYTTQQSDGHNNDNEQPSGYNNYYPVNSGHDDKPSYMSQETGNHNNYEQQNKPVNSGSQQYNGYNENSKPSGGQQHNGYDANHNQDQNVYDQGNNDFQYPVQSVQTLPSDTSLGPSIQSPSGPLERPRPTIDQVVSANGNPYQDYLYPNQNIDIR